MIIDIKSAVNNGGIERIHERLCMSGAVFGIRVTLIFAHHVDATKDQVLVAMVVDVDQVDQFVEMQSSCAGNRTSRSNKTHSGSCVVNDIVDVDVVFILSHGYAACIYRSVGIDDQRLIGATEIEDVAMQHDVVIFVVACSTHQRVFRWANQFFDQVKHHPCDCVAQCIGWPWKPAADCFDHRARHLHEPCNGRRGFAYRLAGYVVIRVSGD